jgi:hypothetical protein
LKTIWPTWMWNSKGIEPQRHNHPIRITKGRKYESTKKAIESLGMLTCSWFLFPHRGSSIFFINPAVFFVFSFFRPFVIRIWLDRTLPLCFLYSRCRLIRQKLFFSVDSLTISNLIPFILLICWLRACSETFLISLTGVSCGSLEPGNGFVGSS